MYDARQVEPLYSIERLQATVSQHGMTTKASRSSVTNTSSIQTACPYCRKSYDVPAAAEGRRAKCASCGKSFHVHDIDAPPLDPMPLLPDRKYVGVACHVCGTQMYGRPADVGRRLRCPDCDAVTLLTPPRESRSAAPRVSDDAYEVVDDESPGQGEALGAAASEGFTFHCSLCDTLLAGTMATIGETVDCPVCGRVNQIPQPAERTYVAPVDDDGYQLDESQAAPGEDIRSSMYADYLNPADEEEQEKRIARVATNRTARPTPPPLPTVNGVWKILKSPGLFSRWLAMTSFFCVALLVAGWSIGALSQTGLGFAMAYAIMGFCFLMLAALTVIANLALLAAIGVVVVTESSEGNDTVEQWPSSLPTDWVGEFIYVVVAFTVGGLPGWIIAQGAPSLGLPLVATSSWLLGPVVLLSQLEAANPLALLVPKVIARIGPTLHHWLLFYLVSGVQFAVAAGVTIGLGMLHPAAALVGVPAMVTAAILYFRGIGRLAWVMRHEE